ncbi:MAG: long-chain fatty acid--CoA ligase [Alphaproteobacteria bacterium]|nr:long-chain fatty acid--CoA ligase [Alphaproteobacteria bacterium]
MSTTYGLHRSLLLNRNGTAIRFEDRSRTWGELGDRVARLAGALRSLGVASGDRVAVLMLNQDRYLELYLAVAWLGAVIVPLNIRWSALENEDAIRDCGPKILVADAAFAAMAKQLAGKVGSIRLVYADDAPNPASSAGMLDFEDLLAKAQPIEDAQVPNSELCGIFYTGGTTGRSKGVMLSHGNLMSNSRNMLAEGLVSKRGTYLHAAPMFHLADVAATYVHFLAGSSHGIVRMFTPEATAQAIEKFKITETLLVPTMIQMLVDHPALAKHDVSSLQNVLYGASPISEAVLDRAMAKLPHTKFQQAYGMTELSPCATILPWEDHIGEGRAKGRHRSGGRPTYMVDVRIVDGDDKPVPRGTVGEIVARGETVMMGYWERPEETARAVVDGWMHTGDGGYMDEDGYVYIVDRIKDMIVSGGENVYSAEVENCIAQHSAVAQCAVIGIPSEQWGEQVHAVVMRKPGAEVMPEDIIAFCKERIAGYKCPRSVKIQDDPLPLSGAGKILKRDLRAPYWEGKTRAVN